MKITLVSLVLLLFTGCFATSGVFTNEATEQVNKAELLQLQVELRNAAQAEEAYFAINGSYTTDVTALNLNPPSEIAIVITQTSAADYCIEATHSGFEESNLWHVSKSDPSPVEGGC